MVKPVSYSIGWFLVRIQKIRQNGVSPSTKEVYCCLTRKPLACLWHLHTKMGAILIFDL